MSATQVLAETHTQYFNQFISETHTQYFYQFISEPCTKQYLDTKCYLNMNGWSHYVHCLHQYEYASIMSTILTIKANLQVPNLALNHNMHANFLYSISKLMSNCTHNASIKFKKTGCYKNATATTDIH